MKSDGASGFSTELAVEGLADDGGRISAHVPSVARDLAHQRRADKAVLLSRRQEDGINIRLEIGVCVGDLQLVFEVGRSAQPSDDNPRTLLFAEVDEEPVERRDSDISQVRADSRDKLEALIDGEQGVACRMLADAHDDVTEERRCALDEIEVPERWRIEAPSVYSQP